MSFSFDYFISLLFFTFLIFLTYKIYKNNEFDEFESIDISNNIDLNNTKLNTTMQITPMSLFNIIAYYPSNSQSIIINNNNIVIIWLDDINYQQNLDLSKSSNNLTIDNTYEYPMVNFSSNTSFIKSQSLTNDIGGFIAVVKVLDKEYNYLYSSINENLDSSFKSLEYRAKEYDNDLQSKGSIYYNGKCVFDYTNQNNAEQFIGSTVNNLVIVYVNLKNLSTENLHITLGSILGSTFMNRGFRGLIGDFIVFNKNHTKEDQIYMEGFLAKKWGLSNKLNINHMFHNTYTSL